MTCRAAAVLSIALVVWTAPPAAADVGDNSVGMNIHVGRETFIDACADLGVGWVRMDGNWFVMEPSEDNYNWTWMDNFVTRAHDAGLKVFISLGYTPDWVPSHSEAGEDPYTSGDNCPDDATHWVDFVEDAVTHYRAMGVTHFGMWNEPNLGGFFDGTVEEYVDIIMVPGAAAVRQVCADCKVLGPELANVGDCDTYLEDIFDRAPASTFDIITHHSYNGFTETGWNIWDGDGFINVLDDQRIPGFTRKDLRQILDAAGWNGEVWITETGYRATPVGDQTEEDYQAIYYTRVLEEQLNRAWFTNSFFYEIMDCKPDQPECTIDGFGIIRAESGEVGSRTFPDDFRLKPAYAALKQFIEDHPEITGTEPPPECGDGVDNDSDGQTDLEDRGCTGPLDDDESDDPPRKMVTAYRTPGISMDGNLDDAGDDGWLHLGTDDWRGVEPLEGAGDLAVDAAVRWESSALYLLFDVTDDTHVNSNTPAQLWLGDSVQLAFDIGANGGSGYDAYDHEFGFALIDGASEGYRFHGSGSGEFGVSVARQGNHTYYELYLPASDLSGVAMTAGSRLRFSFLVNENDGDERLGWMEWTAGIGVSKEPEFFGELEFSDELSPAPQPDGGDDGGTDAGPDGEDAGPDAGFDGGVDAGGDTGIDDGADSGGADFGTDSGSADEGDTGSGEDGGTADEDTQSEGCGCSATSAGGRTGCLALLVLVCLLAVGCRRNVNPGADG